MGTLERVHSVQEFLGHLDHGDGPPLVTQDAFIGMVNDHGFETSVVQSIGVLHGMECLQYDLKRTAIVFIALGKNGFGLLF